MRNIRYLLDENVDPILRRELIRHEPELVVWRIGDPKTPPRGTLDPAILVWCEENSFILVTNNRRSMPGHLRDHLTEGRHTPGIFALNSQMSLGKIIDELTLIWDASDITNYRDQIFYLPL